MTPDEPDMKPLQGVHSPDNTSMWHFRKKTPIDLLEHPSIQGEKWAFRGSLKTASLREANALAVQKLAELEALWATYRAALRVTNPEDVPPVLVTAIAQQLRVLVLAEDEQLREDPSALASSLAHWWQAKEHARFVAHQIEYGPPPAHGPPQEEELGRHEDPPPPPFRSATMPRWLTPRGQQEVADYVQAGRPELPLYELLPMLRERHQAAAAEAREAMARGSLGPFLLLADSAAKVLGVNLGPEGWRSPQAKTLRVECQRAYLAALEGLAERDTGLLVETPPAPDVPKAEQPKTKDVLTLEKVVAAVLAEHPENGFKRKVETTTRLLLALMVPTTPVESIKQTHVSDFLGKVCRLPTDWYVQVKRGRTPLQLLAEEHTECISPTTFESTYRASMSIFLKRAAHAFGDQGFPHQPAVTPSPYGSFAQLQPGGGL